ncbi:MAG TPA: XdhC family protein [Casimicrobiaceae bacterium]|nr:XdhC family protein [Casimicrobiaceae bacterium]
MTEASTDLFAVAQRLQQQGQPYALVSVVHTEAPASARPGDKALVTAQGIVHGWIGGGCAQPAVLHTVRQALEDGCARLIRISPASADASRDPQGLLSDALEFGMSCHSGGTIELFIDPILPPTRLIVIGDSPVAVAVAALAPRVGLPVTVIARGADAQRFADASQVIDTDDATAVAAQVAPGCLVVVATQGRRDLQGLRAALALKALRVWLVASARKAQVLRELLIAAQYDPQAVNAIVAPAGQPIGARTPEEIALSVLASVVAVRRAARSAPGEGAAAKAVAGGTPTAAEAVEQRVAAPVSAESAPSGGAPQKCCSD